jgi:GNAT superfamily N-acetyltransferase
MTQPLIRRATPADAADLATIGALTFAETFGHLYPPHDLAEFIARQHTPAAAGALLAREDTGAWLVEVEGRAVGHALAGPCGLPHPEVTPACGELKRLYLLAEWQGGGLGGRLMGVVLDWLQAQGRTRIWVGVWSQNHGAHRLYARAGFERVGEYEFIVGATRDQDFILRRS